MISRTAIRTLQFALMSNVRNGIPSKFVHKTTSHLPITNTPSVYRMYSGQVNAQAQEWTADFDEVKKATQNSDILIVDVREPSEIQEHGKIPNSLNIPLGTIPAALGMSEKEFQKTYQRAKPSENAEIIFYCKIGRRSGMAQQNAINMGYKNTKNYLGSWTEWAQKST